MIECRICCFKSSNFKIFESESCVPIIFSGKIIRYQCSNCHVIFGNEYFLNISQEELFNKYKLLFENYKDLDFSNREIEVVLSLNPKKDDKILIFGCGNTSSVLQLRQMGYNVFGYEPNIDLKYEFIFNSLNINDKYKFIISNDVIEHLQDPIKSLNLMKNMLQEGGKMAHRTECYNYIHDCSPFHLYFFIGKSLDILSSKIKMNKVISSLQDTIIFE